MSKILPLTVESSVVSPSRLQRQDASESWIVCKDRGKLPSKDGIEVQN